MNREIVKAKVNADTVKGLDDEQLFNLIYSKASQLRCGTFGEHFTNSPGHLLLCEVFSTAVLDSEVRNGGFDQFFYNDPALFPFAINGLIKIGAALHAELAIRAGEIYEAGKAEFQDDRNPNLDALDDEYYTMEEFYPLQAKFIRENIEKFFD